jgi:hypothetical protein
MTMFQDFTDNVDSAIPMEDYLLMIKPAFQAIQVITLILKSN